MEPSTPEFWQNFSSMGIGGMIAVFAIWLLNKAWKEHSQLRIEDARMYQERLITFHEVERGRTEMLVGIVKEVSNIVTKNTVVTESLHRRLDRDAAERAEHV